MSRCIVWHGAGAECLVPREYRSEQVARTTFALLTTAGLQSLENGGFFGSPDGRCHGLLAGRLFNWSCGGDAESTQKHQLGVWITELYDAHGLDFPNALDGAFVLVMLIDDRRAVGPHGPERPDLERSGGGSNDSIAVARDRWMTSPGGRSIQCGGRMRGRASDAGRVVDVMS